MKYVHVVNLRKLIKEFRDTPDLWDLEDSVLNHKEVTMLYSVCSFWLKHHKGR